MKPELIYFDMLCKPACGPWLKIEEGDDNNAALLWLNGVEGFVESGGSTTILLPNNGRAKTPHTLTEIIDAIGSWRRVEQ